MNNAHGPDHDGYFWVRRTNGLWDVAAWRDQRWMVLGYEAELSTEQARIVEWRPIEEPGPTELQR